MATGTGKSRKATKRSRAEDGASAPPATSGKRRKRPFQMPLTISHRELLDDNGKSDRRFRQFLYDFSALGAYLQSAREYLAAQLGLTAPQYNCVMIVAQYQGAEGISVTEIARHLHVSIAFVTSEMRKLEKEKLIEKRRNPEDGRGVLVRLTPGAETKVMKLKKHLQFVNDSLFGNLSGASFSALANTAAALIEPFTGTVETVQQMGRGPRRGNRQPGQA
jgi:DNA-binding MarR family transcriptional regulator